MQLPCSCKLSRSRSKYISRSISHHHWPQCSRAENSSHTKHHIDAKNMCHIFGCYFNIARVIPLYYYYYCFVVVAKSDLCTVSGTDVPVYALCTSSSMVFSLKTQTKKNFFLFCCSAFIAYAHFSHRFHRDLSAARISLFMCLCMVLACLHSQRPQNEYCKKLEKKSFVVATHKFILFSLHFGTLKCYELEKFRVPLAFLLFAFRFI